MKLQGMYLLLYFYLALLVLIIVLFCSAVEAQSTFPANLENPRANFTDEFKGRKTWIYYTDETGKVVVEPYVTQLGLYRKDLDAISLRFFNEAGNPADFLKHPGLAEEHHWMSFEMAMKAQRELGACLAAWSEHEFIAGRPAVDAPGNPASELFRNLVDYWVPFHANDNFGEHPPGLKTHIEHFKAGITGVNLTINVRDWCRPLRDRARQGTIDYINSIWAYVILLEMQLGIR